MISSSLDRSDKRSKIAAFHPLLSFGTASLAKAITNLADNACGTSSDDCSSRYNHVGWDDCIGQYFRTLFDKRERSKHAVGTNVDVRVNSRRRDMSTLSDEDIITDPNRVISWLAVVYPHWRMEDDVGRHN